MSSLELRATLFRGFADRSRLAILATLVGGSRRVTDVVEATGLTQSNVSGHLACLWDCGLVARERRGREIHYRLVPGVGELLSAADALLDQAGDTVGACPRYGTRAAA
jgi:DNA-binding transcriptional ArsR family regulator